MGKIFIRRQSLKFFIFFQITKFDFQNFLFFAIAQGVEKWKPQAKMLNIEGAIAFWNFKKANFGGGRKRVWSRQEKFETGPGLFLRV